MTKCRAGFATGPEVSFQPYFCIIGGILQLKKLLPNYMHNFIYFDQDFVRFFVYK